MSMESFFTRSNANAGIDLPLYSPSGEKTEFSLHVVGVDSDLFRNKELEEKRRAATDVRNSTDQSEYDRLVHDSKIRLIASCITSWNFEEECSQENKERFLREAPQILNQINQHMADRTLFFVNASQN